MKKLLILVISCAVLFSFSPVYAGSSSDYREKGKTAIEKIREAGRKIKLKAKKAKSKWKDGAEKRRKFYRKAATGTKRFNERVRKNWKYGSEKSRKLYKKVKENYARNIQKIKDPKLRKQAASIFGKGLELRQKFKDAKERSVKTGIDALADFPIGNKTFGDIIGKKLAKKFPSLDRAGLLDRDTAIATVLTDKFYFFTEVDFVRKGGRSMSIADAIAGSSPFSSKTIGYLNVAASLDKLNSADDVGKAINGLIGAMDTVR